MLLILNVFFSNFGLGRDYTWVDLILGDQQLAPLVPHHLHDDGDGVDGDTVEGIQHGLLAEPKVETEPAKRDPANPLGFRWRVPLLWVDNPYGVLALSRDKLDA